MKIIILILLLLASLALLIFQDEVSKSAVKAHVQNNPIALNNDLVSEEDNIGEPQGNKPKGHYQRQVDLCLVWTGQSKRSCRSIDCRRL